MREQLFEAARKAAQAIGYVGAGTVEFLADEKGGFYFLEMNTRLQVEHPVTESTTGVDLVALQFGIAAGERLPAEPPAAVGHSIEVRLYAEDPGNDWQPQTGTLHRFELPGSSFAAGGPREGTPWIRVDSGVVSGSEVSPYYDAMLAKVIVWGATRAQAAARLAAELERAEIHGIKTNRDLLVRVLRHPAFLAGNTDTAFFERHWTPQSAERDARAESAGDEAAAHSAERGAAREAAREARVGGGLGEPLVDPAGERLAAVAAALADAASRRERAAVQSRLPSGWRNLPSQPQRKSYRVGETQYDIDYRLTRDGLVAEGNAVLVEASAERVVLEVDGVRRALRVAAYPGLVCVGSVALTPVERFPDPSQQLAEGALVAPMPGSVVRVGVAVGDRVTRGQGLVWLEAMKMEHTISAPADGVVTELAVAAGQQVEVGVVLAVVQVEEDA
jgi:propionyl-CoA carboxylase alpha chain